jgi:N6-adenosine-specific RNA methylase IME4
MYRTVCADPPWLERGAGQSKRGADKHYDLMPTRQIIALLRTEIEPQMAEDCHLWLWVTNNFLQDGLDVIAALGFRYITNMAWVKERFGLGQYLRGQHELCLFASRGAAQMPPVRDVPSVVHCPRGEHSVKPQILYDHIERVSPAPRLEVFARHKRPGWAAFGNEVEATLFAEASNNFTIESKENI